MKTQEVTKLAERMDLIKRFNKAYGSTNTITTALTKYPEMFRYVKFFDDAGRFVGFLALTDYSCEVNNKFGQWIISDGYVKPPYRNTGWLRKMLSWAIQQHNGKIGAYIDAHRLGDNLYYYKSLGFTHAVNAIGTDTMCYIFPSSSLPLVQERDAAREVERNYVAL